MKLRCSSLPHLFACPASAHGSLSVTGSDTAAAGGSAAHAAMTQVVLGLDPDLDFIALRFNVDRDELGRLVWYGRKAWKELAPSFPDPETEVEVKATMAGCELLGHLDLRSRVVRQVRILDWKSGRVDRDYYHQLAGYAACEMDGTDVDEVVFSVVWLRDQEVETYRFTREMMRGWVGDLRAIVARASDFRTGTHCAYCPRSHECPAVVAVARRDIAMFAGPDAEAMLSTATPAQLVAIRRRARMLAPFAESVDGLLRKIVGQTGPLDTGDGAELRLVEEPGPRRVDTLTAFPILQAHFNDEELASCLTVGLGDAEKIIGDRAPHGQKGRAKKAFGEELAAAGAITQGTVSKLKEVRKPREIT